MTLEFVLLLAVFTFFLMGAMIHGPNDAFRNSGAQLGARVERAIITGDGFTFDGRRIRWERNN